MNELSTADLMTFLCGIWAVSRRDRICLYLQRTSLPYSLRIVRPPNLSNVWSEGNIFVRDSAGDTVFSIPYFNMLHDACLALRALLNSFERTNGK